MLYKKSIILNSLQNQGEKAVVNLNCVDGDIVGEVRLYNFQTEPQGVLTLGMLVENKVIKSGLTHTGYMVYSFNSVLTAIPQTFSCALIQSKQGESKAILYGGGAVDNHLEEGLIQSLSALNMKKIEEVKKKLNENIGDYDNQEEIEKCIDNCLKEPCNRCQNCVYKKAFYDNQTKTICNDIKEDIIKGKMRVPELSTETKFIDEISKQINLLFESYPEETTLEEIIPNSKWVKVDFNNENKFYVVGLIYKENGEVEYICYGIPAKYSEIPPKDFNENAQFLPLNLEFPNGDGYWITYQDANSGNLIHVNII